MAAFHEHEAFLYNDGLPWKIDLHPYHGMEPPAKRRRVSETVTCCDPSCLQRCWSECEELCHHDCDYACDFDCPAECPTDCPTDCVDACAEPCNQDCPTECSKDCTDDCTEHCADIYSEVCSPECQLPCTEDCPDFGICLDPCAGSCTRNCPGECICPSDCFNPHTGTLTPASNEELLSITTASPSFERPRASMCLWRHHQHGVCGYYWKDEEDCFKHLKAHFKSAQGLVRDPDSKKFVCPWGDCTVPQSNKSHIERHILGAHNLPKPYRCTADPEGICQQTFATKQQKLVHENSVHLKLKKCVCTVEGCDYSTPHQHCLDDHMLHKHNTDNHPYCRDCCSVIRGSTNMNHHTNAFHKYGVKCTDCDALNRTAKKMRKHMETEGHGDVVMSNPGAFDAWWTSEEARVYSYSDALTWKAVQEQKTKEKTRKNAVRRQQRVLPSPSASSASLSGAS